MRTMTEANMREMNGGAIGMYKCNKCSYYSGNKYIMKIHCFAYHGSTKCWRYV